MNGGNLSNSSTRGASIRVVLPFCSRHCCFCRLPNSRPQEDVLQDYLAALSNEARYLARLYPHIPGNVSAVYIGGGCPLCAGEKAISSVIQTLSLNFRTHEANELTVEAAPWDISRRSLALLEELGAHRLYIGVQTLNDQVRALLDLPLDKTRLCRLLRTVLEETNIPCLHVDLMLGLPGQGVESMFEDLETVIHEGVHSISLFKTVLYEETGMAELVRSKRLQVPTAHRLDRIKAGMVALLKSNGYLPDNSVKFHLPGCEHLFYRLVYKENRDCLNLGISNRFYFSRIKGSVRRNPDTVQGYIRAWKNVKT